MLSFIVPAYNEANQIADVVRSIREAAEAVGVEHEILVINDASEDDTAALARAAGAVVHDVELRQIAAVRNAGAARARGDVLVFVDGDTFLNEVTLRAALAALDDGAVGGGALMRFDDAPWTAQLACALVARGMKVFGLCGGAFVYVRRDAFEAVGGFDGALFASEEVALAKSLSGLKRGRFVVVREPIITSGRKARRYSTFSLFYAAFRIGLRGQKGVRRREGLEIWYDGVREEARR